MSQAAQRLHPISMKSAGAAGSRQGSSHNTGVLPSEVIKELIRAREIRAVPDVEEDQIQPASLDLRLGEVAYRVPASFLPGKERSVRDCIESFKMHRFELADGALLEKGCVYIIPLIEHLSLGTRISAVANPKSSIGRLDIFTRLITDRGSEFDRVRKGYHGKLYGEISPRAFSVVVRQGSRLNQIRFRRGAPTANDEALWRLHEQVPLIDRPIDRKEIARGLPLSVDLLGEGNGSIVGFKAKKHTGLIDVDLVGHYDPFDYWEPIEARRGRGIILNPDDFYVLASKEAVTVPPDHAAEMVAYDTLVGEFRVHYAGFFDPGFGHPAAGGEGTRAVLEVRSHEVPFIVEDGQIMGRLLYERMTAQPGKLYGQAIGSSYQRQGLALSKQFRQPG